MKFTVDPSLCPHAVPSSEFLERSHIYGILTNFRLGVKGGGVITDGGFRFARTLLLSTLAVTATRRARLEIHIYVSLCFWYLL
jgi:hypothetical protein